jgi:hypothetical protein
MVKKVITIRISIGWFGCLLTWSLISGVVGICLEGDGFDFGRYFGYTMLFGLYMLLACIPFGGIYFLVTSGNVTSTLLSIFSITGNGWLVYGVDGLFIVLGIAAQVIWDMVAFGVMFMIHKALNNS